MNSFSQLGNVSGPARDLDVLRESILQPLLCSEAESAIEPLMRRSLQDCAQERRTAHAALSALPHGVLLLTFSKELHRLSDSHAHKPLASFARQRLKRLHARAERRLGAVLQNPTPEMVHRLRIAFKNLRYASEYFTPLFEAAAVNRFVKELSELQDELGFLHDLDVGLQRLDAWAKEDPALHEARQHVENWHAERATKALDKISTGARVLLAARPPWQKDA